VAGNITDFYLRLVLDARLIRASQQELLRTGRVCPVYFPDDVLIAAIIPYVVLAYILLSVEQVTYGAWLFTLGQVSFQGYKMTITARILI
jgi:hypothetical protein